MRNEIRTKIKRILISVEELPYFTLDDLFPIEKNKNYLNILFSRQEKAGVMIRLKKGFYVTERYLLNHSTPQEMKFYCEFLANTLYKPSYLSMDYVLYEHNLLTEIPVNYTCVTENKTAKFSNRFGNFFYHKIKEEMFIGFDIIKKNNFIILKDTKAKALFDFLYLRKNLLVDEKAVEEMRLNFRNLTNKDIKELKKYISKAVFEKMSSS